MAELNRIRSGMRDAANKIDKNFQKIDESIQKIDGDIQEIDENLQRTDEKFKRMSALIVNTAYPVGAYYISNNSTSPDKVFGVGTWKAITGRTIVGVDPGDGTFNSAGKTGGEKEHTLSTGEMPSHTHAQNEHAHRIDHDHGGVNTSWNGSHVHNINSGGNSILVTGGEAQLGGVDHDGQSYSIIQGMRTDEQGAHNHWVDLPNYSGWSWNTTASNQNTGGGAAHNNLPPFITAYIWQRTA